MNGQSVAGTGSRSQLVQGVASAPRDDGVHRPGSRVAVVTLDQNAGSLRSTSPAVAVCGSSAVKVRPGLQHPQRGIVLWIEADPAPRAP